MGMSRRDDAIPILDTLGRWCGIVRSSFTDPHSACGRRISRDGECTRRYVVPGPGAAGHRRKYHRQFDLQSQAEYEQPAQPELGADQRHPVAAQQRRRQAWRIRCNRLGPDLPYRHARPHCFGHPEEPDRALLRSKVRRGNRDLQLGRQRQRFRSRVSGRPVGGSGREHLRDLAEFQAGSDAVSVGPAV